MKAALFFIAALIASAIPIRAVTLETAMAQTLENNPAIKEAKLGLEEAAGRRLVFRATALPDFRMALPLGLEGGKRAGENNPQPFTFVRAFFGQPLFHAAIPASYRRGNIEVLLAQQRLNVAVVEQLHTARIAFYTAAYNQSLVTLGEAQRQRLSDNVRAQNERYDAGQADRHAVISARVLEEELRPRIEDARRAYSGALLQLGQTMRQDLGPGAKLPTAEANLQFAPVSMDLEADAASGLARRPDLKLARLLVRAATDDQRIIEAVYYPAISAVISGLYIPVTDLHSANGGSGRRADDSVSSRIGFGGTYTWRVIDNGKVGGAVIQQRAVREINQEVVAKLEADVPRELRRIQNNLRSLQSRYDSLSKAVAVSDQNVTVVQNNLAQGLASELEYRDAESSFLQTKAGILGIAFEQNVALAERDRVTGRYFQFSDDTTGNVH